ncbi:retinoschisin [Exaiptasia diaphana]|uniref:F5/8 type C domain-containing protein n=1 Tax=Exaiptasia diaphana TaxID=2652724 RepID=A0A913YRS8_EXADI|nr:retinoschisin [Exaiptasia diaphana]
MPTLLKQELLRFLLCVMLNMILLCTSPTKGIQCITNPLGMSSGDIINDRLSASSFQRLTINPRLHSKSCWCPESRDFTPYLTIDLGSHHVVCAVGTQGCNIADRWVKSYHISISSNGILWSLYKESNVTRIFYGNHDRSTISHELLYHSPTARYVRIAPQTYHGAPCLRMEIYGYQLESSKLTLS